MLGDISNWLLERAITDADLDETVAGLRRRLVRGGVPVFRFNFGSIVLHPVLGALDITWDALSDTCRSKAVPRIAVKTPEFQNSPFFLMVNNNSSFERHRLDDPKVRSKYALFETLAGMGTLPTTWRCLHHMDV